MVDNSVLFSLSWRPSDREFEDDSDTEALSVSINDVPYENSWASGCGAEWEESRFLFLGRLIGVDRLDLARFRGEGLEIGELLRVVLPASGAEGQRLDDDDDEATICVELP